MRIIRRIFLIFLIITIFSFFRFALLNDEEEVNIYQAIPEVKMMVQKPAFFDELSLKVDSVVENWVSKHHFNGCVLVSSHNSLLYKNSFGYDSYSSQTELTTDSPFQLASVSKQFTAMSIMLLKERNKLSFEDEVTKYFPDFPYSGISIKNLLNHTSGLPNYMWVVEHYWKEKQPPTNAEALQLLIDFPPSAYFKPGSRFNYSNTNYFVLASIVEKISGLNFADFVQSNIFLPLGMNHSFIFSPSSKREYPELIKGFRNSLAIGRGVDVTLNDGVSGDKEVYSSVQDLFLWEQALNNGSLISDSLLHEAYKPAKLNNGKFAKYGFGYRLREFNGQSVAYHNGLWNGFRTSYYRYIKTKSAIIILNNTNCSSINQLVDEIEKIICDKKYITS